MNAPNWQYLDLRIGQGTWWSDGGLRAEDDQLDLDLRRGILLHRVFLVDGTGRRHR